MIKEQVDMKGNEMELYKVLLKVEIDGWVKHQIRYK